MPRPSHRTLADPPAFSPWQNGLDLAIEALLVVMLVFAPLAYGATEPRGQEALIAASAAVAVVLAVRLVVVRSAGFVWTWAYLPIALFLLGAALQLVALPVGLIRLLSPHTVATKARLLGGAGGPAAIDRTTLTFYALATSRDLRLLAVPVTVFVAVVNVYRRGAQVKRLLLAVATIGGAVAAYALYQGLTGARTIWGVFGWREGGAHAAGPFANHGHFAQFINLSVGAALGLILVKLRELAPRGERSSSSSRAALAGLNDPRAALVWPMAAVVAAGAVAVVLSLSRGGTVAMLLAGGATAALLALAGRGARGHRRGSLVLALGLLGVVCLIYAGFDSAYERMATLRHLARDPEGRAQILRDVTALWRRFPLTGTGLGTFEFTFPMVDRSVNTQLATHAENEYAQLVAETGAVGVALALAFLGVVVAGYARSVRHLRRPAQTAAWGLGFGLMAAVIHSAADFGQHTLGVAVLTAVTCGLLVSLARFGRTGTASARAGDGTPVARESGSPVAAAPALPVTARQRLGAPAAAVALAAFSFWALVSADRARRAAAQWDLSLEQGNAMAAAGWDTASDEQLADLIDATTAAVDREPGNVTYRYGLSLYRWNAISRAVDPETNQPSAASMAFAGPIADELDRAKPLCPTYGPPYSLAGQIRYFVLGQPEGKVDIETGYQLAAYQPNVCWAAGRLDVREQRWEASLEKLRRAVKLDPSLMKPVLQLYVDADRPDLAHAAAAGNTYALTVLAERLDGVPGQQDLAAACRAEVDVLVRVEAERPDATPDTLVAVADLHARDGDIDRAARCYRNALATNYARVDWHLRLARMLAKAGRTAEALDEARTCLQLDPNMAEAKAMVLELDDPAAPGPDTRPGK